MRVTLWCLTVAAAGCQCSKSEAAFDAGPSGPVPTAAIQAGVDAALAKRQQGDSLAASTLLLELAAKARAANDVAGEALALHRAGDTLLDRHECGPSRKRYLEALALHRQGNDRIKLGLVANDLGLWSKHCQLEEAVGWFSLAMSYRRGDDGAFGVSANNLGAVFWNINRPEEANLAYQEALVAAERASDPVLQRKVLANLALLWVLIAEGHYDFDPLAENAPIDALLESDAGVDDLLRALDARTSRFDHDDTEPRPIPPGSPALATARDYFRRAIEAAKKAGEDPIVVCSSLGSFDNRCEVLNPKTP
ncbi:MAG: hypothetical protein GQE15_06325 [Archangiaceae bacterium]|nr:hypothetical protein [Archangiaceae bacterium]